MSDEPLSPTPFDDVFKTLLDYDPKLIIPVVNEMFHTSYPRDAEIHFIPTELHEHEGDQHKKVTSDSCFEILGFERSIYIIECQSTKDTDMLCRLAEYGIREAMKNRKMDEDGLHLLIPNLGVLYLRSGANILTGKAIYISDAHSDQSLRIQPAAIETQKYDLAEIASKKLEFLVPFFPFSIEQDLKSNDEARVFAKVAEASDNVIAYLGRLTEKGDISQSQAKTLLALYEYVQKGLIRKQPETIKKGVADIMAGGIIKLRDPSAWTAAVAKGREEGLAEGKKETALSMFMHHLNFAAVQSILKLPKEKVQEYYDEYKAQQKENAEAQEDEHHR